MFIIVIFVIDEHVFYVLRNNRFSLYIYALKMQIRRHLEANCTRKIIYEIDLVISR